MYGMIHRGIRQMVIESAGEAQWSAIEESAQIGPAELISANVYEDALTARLLQTVADHAGEEMEHLMHRLGRYWIRFVERGPYGAIMDFTGHDLPSFIANLDRMHQAVLMAMPEAKVPSFALEAQEDGTLTVRYMSERTGLEPLVVGLLEGLLDRFGLTGSVERASPGANAARFTVRYRAA